MANIQSESIKRIYSIRDRIAKAQALGVDVGRQSRMLENVMYTTKGTLKKKYSERDLRKLRSIQGELVQATAIIPEQVEVVTPYNQLIGYRETGRTFRYKDGKMNVPIDEDIKYWQSQVNKGVDFIKDRQARGESNIANQREGEYYTSKLYDIEKMLGPQSHTGAAITPKTNTFSALDTTAKTALLDYDLSISDQMIQSLPNDQKEQLRDTLKDIVTHTPHMNQQSLDLYLYTADKFKYAGGSNPNIEIVRLTQDMVTYYGTINKLFSELFKKALDSEQFGATHLLKREVRAHVVKIDEQDLIDILHKADTMNWGELFAELTRVFTIDFPQRMLDNFVNK